MDKVDMYDGIIGISKDKKYRNKIEQIDEGRCSLLGLGFGFEGFELVLELADFISSL
jgi:hypothetical protein